MKYIHYIALSAVTALLTACATPAAIDMPSDDVVDGHTIKEVKKIPPSPWLGQIMAGDTMVISPQSQVSDVQPIQTKYVVGTDGYIQYPFVGKVQAEGLTPSQLGDKLTKALASTFVDPRVTVNVIKSPGSRVYVGGAVKRPGSFSTAGTPTIPQLIISAGGVLPTAESGRVVLLRMAKNRKYDVYFIDFSKLITPEKNLALAVKLEAGDIVYVPRSAAGKAADAVNLYANQLVPFSKTFGVGLTYGTSTYTLN